MARQRLTLQVLARGYLEAALVDPHAPVREIAREYLADVGG